MYSPESGNWPLQYLKTNTRKLWGFREREREREGISLEKLHIKSESRE